MTPCAGGRRASLTCSATVGSSCCPAPMQAGDVPRYDRLTDDLLHYSARKRPSDTLLAAEEAVGVGKPIKRLRGTSRWAVVCLPACLVGYAVRIACLPACLPAAGWGGGSCRCGIPLWRAACCYQLKACTPPPYLPLLPAKPPATTHRACPCHGPPPTQQVLQLRQLRAQPARVLAGAESGACGGKQEVLHPVLLHCCTAALYWQVHCWLYWPAKCHLASPPCQLFGPLIHPLPFPACPDSGLLLPAGSKLKGASLPALPTALEPSAITWRGPQAAVGLAAKTGAGRRRQSSSRGCRRGS